MESIFNGFWGPFRSRTPLQRTHRTRSWSFEAPDQQNTRFGTDIGTILGSILGPSRVLLGTAFCISLCKLFRNAPSGKAPSPVWDPRINEQTGLGEGLGVFKTWQILHGFNIVVFLSGRSSETGSIPILNVLCLGCWISFNLCWVLCAGLRSAVEGNTHPMQDPTPVFIDIWVRHKGFCLRRIVFWTFPGYLRRWQNWLSASFFLNLPDSLTDATRIPEGFPAEGWSSLIQSSLV